MSVPIPGADGSTESNETGPIIERMQTDSERRGAE